MVSALLAEFKLSLILESARKKNVMFSKMR